MLDMKNEMNPKATPKRIIDQIRRSVIGEGQLFQTAFGLKPLVYSDYTASGRSLSFIEEYISRHVLPFYANTHSEASQTGRQTSAYREQARALIRKSLNASAEDAVIFCGSGASSAIQKLVDILGIRIPANLDDLHGFAKQIKPNERPVVFVGPYEHHSNELAWRETIADVVCIPLDAKGAIDENILQIKLDEYAGRAVKIASFSAASNVTGLLSDVAGLTRLLHKNGALAFWDYAASGPYVDIDVAGEKSKLGDSSLDALYISPHKFIGGPGTPGVLVVKRKLMKNRVPSLPGGGTVSYVSPQSHTYLTDSESREEGGTPAIVESIRAGLVFQLKDAVGADTIESLEREMVTKAIKRWSQNPAIHILGDLEAPRISIVSFQIVWQDKPLHFGLVDALMNDLFGIQVRGGCSCAGPYGHELLDIDSEHSQAIADAVNAGQTILKPGWVRLNLNYFISEETLEYLLRAVELIAEHGWKMFSKYQYDPARNLWTCQKSTLSSCQDLHEISYEQGQFQSPKNDSFGTRKALVEYLNQAEQLLTDPSLTQANVVCLHPAPNLPKPYEHLRWYSLPCDIPKP